MISSIEDVGDDVGFFEFLFSLEIENVFNPYLHTCREFDNENSFLVRRKNIRDYFYAAKELEVKDIWIGRDLGYRGGRRTGLPLTDEGNISRLGNMMKIDSLHKSTIGAAVFERTATIIWDAIEGIGLPIMLWNVFPYHPHKPNAPMGNRCHTKAERKITELLLRYVLESFSGANVFAIGRDAQVAVEDLGYSSVSVRHPSYGGQREFLSTIEQFYGLSLPKESQLQLL
jgi:hypothetical protein